MKRVEGLRAAIELLGGPQPDDAEAADVAARILDDVRRNGDEAVKRISGDLDGEALTFLEVPRHEIDAALAAIPGETRAALEMAAERVSAFQSAAMPESWHDDERQSMPSQAKDLQQGILHCIREANLFCNGAVKSSDYSQQQIVRRHFLPQPGDVGHLTIGQT